MKEVNFQKVTTFSPLTTTISAGLSPSYLDTLTRNLQSWLGSNSAHFISTISTADTTDQALHHPELLAHYDCAMQARLTILMSAINQAFTQIIDHGHLVNWQHERTQFPQTQIMTRTADQSALLSLIHRSLEAYRHMHMRYMKLRHNGCNADSVTRELQLLQAMMPLSTDLEELTRQEILVENDVPFSKFRLTKRKKQLLQKTSHLTSNITNLHKLINHAYAHPDKAIPPHLQKLASSIITDAKTRQRLSLPA